MNGKYRQPSPRYVNAEICARAVRDCLAVLPACIFAGNGPVGRGPSVLDRCRPRAQVSWVHSCLQGVLVSHPIPVPSVLTIRYTPFMLLYQTYTSNHEAAINTLGRLMNNPGYPTNHHWSPCMSQYLSSHELFHTTFPCRVQRRHLEAYYGQHEKCEGLR